MVIPKAVATEKCVNTKAKHDGSTSGGKWLGKVDDFYVEQGMNAIRALRINMGVYGYHELQASATSSIESNRITIANEQMLVQEGTDGRLPTTISGRQ